MIRLVLRVPADASPTRLDRALAGAHPHLGRRRLAELFRDRRIRGARGQPLRKSRPLRPGEELEVEIDDEEPEALAGEPEAALPLLHLDADLVAVDKPPGRPSVARRLSDRGTVAGFLVGRFPETAAAAPRPTDGGLVHRLDTETSGVLLAARSRAAWEAVRAAFREGRVRKTYLAWVAGRVDAGGTVALPIAGDRRRPARVRVLAPGGMTARGARPARTFYRPLEIRGDATLLEVEIETGVRHQIRAHLAALGHPVLGDGLYGPGRAGLDRHQLHAWRLELSHPTTGLLLRIESRLPFRAERL